MISGTSLKVQWLNLSLQEVWVRSSLGKLRSLMLYGQETKNINNRSNILTNSLKTSKMVHIQMKKTFKKTTTMRFLVWLHCLGSSQLHHFQAGELVERCASIFLIITWE